MPNIMTHNLPKTLNRSQLAIALGYRRDGGGINWKSFYSYLESVLGDNWEQSLNILPRQRVFNAIQTEKLIERLELKMVHFE